MNDIAGTQGYNLIVIPINELPDFSYCPLELKHALKYCIEMHRALVICTANVPIK